MADSQTNDDIVIPGAPVGQPPKLEEQTEPHEPLDAKPDQDGPEPLTATGCPMGVEKEALGQQGAYLTTAQGTRLADTDHSLKAGARGPVFCRTITCGRRSPTSTTSESPSGWCTPGGSAPMVMFTANGAAAGVTKAAFLAEGVETPVFVRFSTVLGSRGSADTVRDTRGFATKFYTAEGTYDLVGNNIPVFFIQDAIKFPDVVHAAKPHPDREIPQAQTAHDTFWDFVSLHTEAQAHTMWNMSDRAIPRSLRTMEGFGIHTFRLVNAAGETSLVKFHWKPKAGVHSLTWEEAQMTAGLDPDFHRRDLADAIEAGAFPQWDFGIQVFADSAEEMFEGIDLLDPTKFVPEELSPVQVIGTMALTANPINYFAETEQVGVPPGTSGARHRRHQRPPSPRAALLLRRHPDHPSRRSELRTDTDQPSARPGERHAPRRISPRRRARAARPRTAPTRSTVAVRSPPMTRTGLSSTCPNRCQRRPRSASKRPVSTTTSARPACSSGR